MNNTFGRYLTSLYHNIPDSVFWWLLAVLCFGMVLLISYKGIREGIRLTLGLLLVEYVVIIFCSTVIYRQGYYLEGNNFKPFWSYQAIMQGRQDLIAENLMNAVVFLPVGLLAGGVFRSINWKKVLVIGMCLSVGIEVLQFVFRKGFSELDDVMHNTIGCLIGYGLFSLIGFGYERVCKRSVGIL